jgi:hypothetical protein
MAGMGRNSQAAAATAMMNTSRPHRMMRDPLLKVKIKSICRGW